MIRNERFRVALDYLYKNGLVADQRELSVKTGLSQKSISHILNNRVQNPSEATIRKLNEAFGNIFNPEYFRCNSENMLADEPVQASEPTTDYVALPKWADSIIQLVTEQVKTIEDLRREVAALHNKINNLTKPVG